MGRRSLELERLAAELQSVLDTLDAMDEAMLALHVDNARARIVEAAALARLDPD